MHVLAGGDVVSLTSHEPSLEEVFLTLYRDDSVDQAPSTAS
jgi:phosphohistidine phosphatase SixA